MTWSHLCLGTGLDCSQALLLQRFSSPSGSPRTVTGLVGLHRPVVEKLRKSSSPAFASAGCPRTRRQRAQVLLCSAARGVVTISTAVSSNSQGTGDSNSPLPCRWAGCVTSSGLRDVSGNKGAAPQLAREGPSEGLRCPHLPAELGVGTRPAGACPPGPWEAHAGLTASGRNRTFTV